MINAKGQYPFWAGPTVRMTPKGGIGFLQVFQHFATHDEFTASILRRQVIDARAFEARRQPLSRGLQIRLFD